MARNYFISFFDDEDNAWVDATGRFMKEPAPCIACEEPTHRYDYIAKGPVCNDGTSNACSAWVWEIYSKALT
jgi:hypothetical protein